jgi:hypothetical protein
MGIGAGSLFPALTAHANNAEKDTFRDDVVAAHRMGFASLYSSYGLRKEDADRLVREATAVDNFAGIPDDPARNVRAEELCRP